MNGSIYSYKSNKILFLLDAQFPHKKSQVWLFLLCICVKYNSSNNNENKCWKLFYRIAVISSQHCLQQTDTITCSAWLCSSVTSLCNTNVCRIQYCHTEDQISSVRDIAVAKGNLLSLKSNIFSFALERIFCSLDSIMFVTTM